MMLFRAAAVAALLIATPAWADPDVHTVALPDGSQIVTISDTNSQFWGPSTNQRVVVHCAADGACQIIETSNASTSFLSGIWGAVGQAVRRPVRVQTSTNVSNDSASTSTSAASAAAAAHAAQSQDQGQGQLQGQLQLQGQGQQQEQAAAGGQGGGGDNGGGNNAACGNGQDGGANGNGQGC